MHIARLTRQRQYIAILSLVLGCYMCSDSHGAVVSNETKSVPFKVTWPLTDPTQKAQTNAHPLLTGSLDISFHPSQAKESSLKLVVTLRRAKTEADRLFWNKTLAFPQYDWMRYVRVWDTNQQWLWPNLPYLLRIYGTERVERYGGWDPGKEVDNDFAAVLIRKYDAAGDQQSPDTRVRPLISAEWHPVSTNAYDKFAIVQEARSDEFTLLLSAASDKASGRVLVWLIYADFMGAPVPSTWPKEPEYNGATLACFQIDWHFDADRGCVLEAVLKAPPPPTEFNWPRWVGRPAMNEKVRATPRLSER